ncbi:unnamed protein product [Spodoptera exigua]|nr:unnamed protein product [Spodoptera exigua]
MHCVQRKTASRRHPVVIRFHLRGSSLIGKVLVVVLAARTGTSAAARRRARVEGAGRGSRGAGLGARGAGLGPRQWRECGDAMRSFVRAATLAALLALAAAAARRSDQDFEFDDDAEAAAAPGGAGPHWRRPAGAGPRRYVYDPHNSLCRSLVCKKREVCVLRDSFTALCATKKDILRRGDTLVAASSSGAAWEEDARDDTDDDVFYDTAAHDTDADPDLDADDAKRCVGCGAGARAQFLCGSDNRTYSSLCRLDLHNCVRRAARPVRLACRGFCPCAPRAPAPEPRAPGDSPRAPAAEPRAPAAVPRAPRRRARLRSRPDHYDDWRRRKSESSHNEVLPERQSRRRLAQGSEGCALDKMANRLLDWFSVLMDEAGASAPPVDGFPRDCKPEVRWMFAHLDTDGDGLLSAANLYALRHDERERCLRPFLASCGGAGAGVARAAWCGCLRRAARPCRALARALAGAGAGGAGGAGYVPACDARGFYRPRQCHAALAVCWCVDAHGQELPGSRTKGAPACPGEKSESVEGVESAENEVAEGEEGAGAAGDAEGAPADDEDGAGSGDAELHF